MLGCDLGELLTRAARAYYLAGDDARSAALLEQAVDEIDAERDPLRAARLLGELADAQLVARPGRPQSRGAAAGARARPRRADARRARGCSPTSCASDCSRVASARSRRSPRGPRDDRGARPRRDQGDGPAPPRLRPLPPRRERTRRGVDARVDRADPPWRHQGRPRHRIRQLRATCSTSAAQRGGAALCSTGRCRRSSESGRSTRWLGAAALARSTSTSATGRPPRARFPSARRARARRHQGELERRVAEQALGRGDIESARPLLEDSWEMLADAVEPQFIAAVSSLRAELELRERQIEPARADPRPRRWTGSSTAPRTARGSP